LDPDQPDRHHLPPPTLWPVGFAVGVACVLVGFVVSWVVTAIGVGIAAVFGFLWVRDLTRGRAATGAERAPVRKDASAAAEPEPGERFPRSKFLEGATLGLGAVIGGVVTVPSLGLVVAPALFEGDRDEIDLGPLSDFPEGEFVIATYMEDPSQGEVTRRTVFVRNNGFLKERGGHCLLKLPNGLELSGAAQLHRT